jgi:hypothetical protein
MPKLSLTQTVRLARNPAFMKGLALTYQGDRAAASSLGISARSVARVGSQWKTWEFRVQEPDFDNGLTDREIKALQKSLGNLDAERLAMAKAFPRVLGRWDLPGKYSKRSRTYADPIEALRDTTSTLGGQRGFRQQMRIFMAEDSARNIDYRRLFGYPSAQGAKRRRSPKRGKRKH